MRTDAWDREFGKGDDGSLLMVCQRIVSACRGVSDPMPAAELARALPLLEDRVVKWRESLGVGSNFDNAVLAVLNASVQILRFKMGVRLTAPMLPLDKNGWFRPNYCDWVGSYDRELARRKALGLSEDMNDWIEEYPVPF